MHWFPDNFFFCLVCAIAWSYKKVKKNISKGLATVPQLAQCPSSLFRMKTNFFLSTFDKQLGDSGQPSLKCNSNCSKLFQNLSQSIDSLLSPSIAPSISCFLDLQPSLHSLCCAIYVLHHTRNFTYQAPPFSCALKRSGNLGTRLLSLPDGYSRQLRKLQGVVSKHYTQLSVKGSISYTDVHMQHYTVESTCIWTLFNFEVFVIVPWCLASLLEPGLTSRPEMAYGVPNKGAQLSSEKCEWKLVLTSQQ